MKFLSDLKNKNLSKQTCLLRVDFNIQDADLRGLQADLRGRIPLRIATFLPSIRFLQSRGAKVVILSHRGRPAPLKREISNSKFLIFKQFSLKPFVKILSSLLKEKVSFIALKEFGLINETKEKIKNSTGGSIFLLENLRFFPGEDKNDKKLAKKLAKLGTFYVNDAFAFSHRKNASMAAITKFLPSYAGLLLEKEIKNVSAAGRNPKRPLVVILGGAKISDKLGLIKNFLNKTNYFLIGGGIANTFVAAQGLPIGDSLYERDTMRVAQKLLKSKKIILPQDFVVKNRKILDIGPKTIKKYEEIIKNAKTIIWNGPMGYIEDKRFRKGSEAIIKAILKSRAFAVIGGGETTSLLTRTNTDYTRTNTEISQYKSVLSPYRSVFISTGGGAMLEYLAGKKLPGIEALNIRKNNPKDPKKSKKITVRIVSDKIRI